MFCLCPFPKNWTRNNWAMTRHLRFCPFLKYRIANRYFVVLLPLS